MPTDWSTRPSSSIATQSEVKSDSAPAELLRHDHAEQPEVAHLGDEVDREVVLAVPAGGVRGDLRLGEVAHERAELFMVLAELEHGGPSWTSEDRPTVA